MTGRVEAKSILLKEFFTNFNTTTPISLKNVDNYILSNGSTTPKPTGEPWVRFYILNNNSDQISYGSTGNRTVRRTGLIAYQVHVPQGSNTNVADTLCQEINDIFELNKFSGIYCYSGTWRESDIQEDGSMMFVGSIPFDTDIRK